MGWLGLAGAVGLGVWFAIDSPTAGGVRAGLVVWGIAWVAWAVLVRPGVDVQPDQVVLTNTFRDVVIPAAAITDVQIRAYLQITANGRRYTSSAAGYRPSSLVRGHADLARGVVEEPGRRVFIENQTAYVLEHLRQVAADARRRTPDPGPVVKHWAVPPLVTLLGLCAAGAATFAF